MLLANFDLIVREGSYGRLTVPNGHSTVTEGSLTALRFPDVAYVCPEIFGEPMKRQ
jgi:hypothetical protein